MQAELVPAHVVAVSALADVWEQMGLVQPYCELLMHFWCESATLSSEVKQRLRALVCRTLGRQGSLTSETLTFIRQHVVRGLYDCTHLSVPHSDFCISRLHTRTRCMLCSRT